VGIVAVQQVLLNCLFAEDKPISNADIKIIVKENSFVKSSHTFLGDVSDIHANGILKEALEKISLGASPKPDKIKSFDRTKIASIIQAQRYLPENIRLISPQRIYVKRLGQTISKEAIRRIIDQNLERIFKNRDYELETFNARGLETYPQGKTELYPDSDDIVDEKGRLSFFLEVVIDGKKEDRVSVSGTVAVYDMVLHMAKSCTKGKAIIKEAVFRKKRNIFDLNDNFIHSFEEIDGKILKAGIRKGEVLKSTLLVDPPLIQKGEIVRLVSKNENLLIVTSAISKEDGFANKLIKVENLNSGKLVRGIVTGKSKVEVVH